MTQRRELDRDDVEAIQQVLAKRALRDGAAKIAMGRGEDADVDRALARRADRAARDPDSSTRSSFACSADRHLADLVEEQRAAVRLGEQARRDRRSRR